MALPRGVGAALSAALLFGVSTPLAQRLLGAMSPLALAGLLYLGSGLGLALLLLLRRQRSPRTSPGIDGAALGWLAAAILCGGVLGPCLLLYGLKLTDAASASLTLNLEGVFTALIAWFAFGENFDRRIALGMALITLGGLALAAAPGVWHASVPGTLLITGACLAWALDNNLTRRIADRDAMTIACAKGLVAGAVSLGLAGLGGGALPAWPLIAQAALLGFACFGMSLTLFVAALRELGAARTAAYFSTAPFVGALLALALGAPPTPVLGLAALSMAAGVWLHVTEHHAHLHAHAALEHEHPHHHDLHHQHVHPAGWDGREPHTHRHVHAPLLHAHAHYPDSHHQHEHEPAP